MALLNRGHMRDAGWRERFARRARYIVGQGPHLHPLRRPRRELDVNQAVDNFLAGRVLVSYGLIADLAVSGKYRGGDLAAVTGDEIPLDLQVLGPHWTTANRVQLYANGQLVREEPIPAGRRFAARRQVACDVANPASKHDVHLVLVALGPGITAPYWPTAKPYQPTSPDWQPYTLAPAAPFGSTPTAMARDRARVMQSNFIPRKAT